MNFFDILDSIGLLSINNFFLPKMFYFWSTRWSSLKMVILLNNLEVGINSMKGFNENLNMLLKTIIMPLFFYNNRGIPSSVPVQKI